MSPEKERWAKLAGIPEQPKKQQLDENIGGVVGVGAINTISHEPTAYEMAFEHYLGERYGNEGEPDSEPLDEVGSGLEYERNIVHKVIDGVRNDFSDDEMLTREYIDAIITALEDLKVTDF